MSEAMINAFEPASVLPDPAPQPVRAGTASLSLRRALLTASMLLPVASTGIGWSASAQADTANAAEYGRGGQTLSSVSGVDAAGATEPAPLALAPDRAPDKAQATPAATDTGANVPGNPLGNAPPNSPPNSRLGASAVTVLVQQAQFWMDQFAPDKAVDALNRAMQLDPHNPDVFAVLAQLQADNGNRGAATAALNQLRQLRPADPRIVKIQQAIATGVISPEDLAHARDLARQGRSPDAVAAYQRIFKGNPPPDRLAIEYYQTLAGVPGGWDQARAGLGELVIGSPDDMKAQLAYAQLLTYQEPSRQEGIQRLMQLVANPVVGAQADEALHQAMLWLPEDAGSVPTLTAFLQTHPNAADVAQRLADAQAPHNGPTDAVGQARQAGFDALNAGKLDVATSIFESVLNTAPQDPDALGGLGIVRLRQGKRDEARTLLSEAIQIDPEHRDRWDQALQGASVVATRGAPNLSGQYAQVRVLAERGDYGQAEQLLNRITGGRGNPGMSLMLADAQARAGHLPEAEASYRTALKGQPANASALIGLANVLMRQGRTGEADELFARAEASGNKTLVARARAEELRQRAQAVGDPSTQAAMYRAANQADPANAWIRLDLARSLVRIGQGREARALMLDATQGRGAGGDNLKAALVYAQEQNDATAANELLAHIPARSRTAELRRFADQAQAQSDINAAAATYRLSPASARQRLLAMAATPDPTGNRTSLVVHALLQAGDTAAARQAINTAIAINPRPSADARLSFAGTLLAVGETSESSMMLADASAGRSLTQDQRTAADGIRTGIAVRSSDALNERGRQADAFDQLAPVLEQQPDNKDANMALARLYQSSSKPRKALDISLNLLRQDPNNLDVRRQAVNAAIAAGDYATAGRLAQEATEAQPNEVKSWLIAAEVAKARGDTSLAVKDLMTARNLRRQQVGTNATSLETDRPSAAPRHHPRVELTQSTGYSTSRVGPTPLTGDAYDQAGIGDQGTVGSGPGAAQPLSVPPTAVAISPSTTTRPRVAAADTSAPLPLAPIPLAPAPLAPQRTAFAASDTMPRTAGGYSPVANPYPVAANPPVNMTQDDGLTNPFRRPGMAVPGGQPYITNGPSDPMVADIDRQIASLQQQAAPTFEAGFALRDRSGTGGLDKLTELMAPIEATFSPGGGPGTFKLQATPTYLNAGKATSGFSNLLVGSNGLTPTSSPLPAIDGHTQATGVGLDAAFLWRWVTADVGSTPVGFQKSNVVGGIELAPPVGTNSTLRFTAERRGVTDSLLSYAGVIDPRTGVVYGAVTRDRIHGQFETGIGKLNLYAGAGYSIYQGTNVANNHEFEAGAGGAYQVYKDPNNEVTVGLDLVYFGYDKNLRYFTLGQGGYFSPQQYFAALVPVNYKGTDGDLTYTIGGSAGMQTFKENPSSVYPLDPVYAAAFTYPGQTQSGFSGGAHAGIDYAVNPNLHVGANASVQHSGLWTETNALAYLRYSFAGAQ